MVAAVTVGPKRIIDIQTDFVESFARTIFFAAKVGHVAYPNHSIQWHMFVINNDDW